MNLAARLKAERERLGFSQTDFAALAGASKHSQINWEKGAAAPNATVLATWAAHGLDVLYVVTGLRSQRVTDQSYAALTPHMTENSNPVTDAPPLNPREQALLANYRGTDERGRRIVESAASAAAHKDGGAKKSQGRE